MDRTELCVTVSRFKVKLSLYWKCKWSFQEIKVFFRFNQSCKFYECRSWDLSDLNKRRLSFLFSGYLEEIWERVYNVICLGTCPKAFNFPRTFKQDELLTSWWSACHILFRWWQGSHEKISIDANPFLRTNVFLVSHFLHTICFILSLLFHFPSTLDPKLSAMSELSLRHLSRAHSPRLVKLILSDSDCRRFSMVTVNK